MNSLKKIFIAARTIGIIYSVQLQNNLKNVKKNVKISEINIELNRLR